MTPSNEQRTLTDSPLQTMSEGDCWRELASADLGRLAMVGPQGIDIFPVNYLVDSSTVVFRSAPGTKLEMIGGGADVAFEVDGMDPPFRWSVVVRGHARRIDADAEIESTGILDLQPDPHREMNNFVRITPTRVTGRRFRVDMPDTTAAVSDLDIAATIRTRLDSSPRLDAQDIQVSVEDGMVTLSGETGSFAERLTARQLVVGVAGVRGVRDATVCSLDGAWDLDDDAVAAAVRRRIAALALPSPVAVSVEAHLVTLTGTVPTQAVRRAVHHETRVIPGVHFVRDELVVAA